MFIDRVICRDCAWREQLNKLDSIGRTDTWSLPVCRRRPVGERMAGCILRMCCLRPCLLMSILEHSGHLDATVVLGIVVADVRCSGNVAGSRMRKPCLLPLLSLL